MIEAMDTAMRGAITAHMEANERELLDGLTYPVAVPDGTDPVWAIRDAYGLTEQTVTLVLHRMVQPATVRMYRRPGQGGGLFLVAEPGTARRIEVALAAAGYTVERWQEGGGCG